MVHKFNSSFYSGFWPLSWKPLPPLYCGLTEIFSHTSGKSYPYPPFLALQGNSHYHKACYYSTSKYESLFQKYNHGKTCFNQSQTRITSVKNSATYYDLLSLTCLNKYSDHLFQPFQLIWR